MLHVQANHIAPVHVFQQNKPPQRTVLIVMSLSGMHQNALALNTKKIYVVKCIPDLGFGKQFE